MPERWKGDHGAGPAAEGPRRGGRLLPDVLAGTSVAVVGIPQAIAYADLAGMPPVSGLYASAVPPIVAALFASSPYLQTGPAAITALLTFGALSPMAAPGSAEYMTLGLGLALVVGVVRIGLGLLRAGWVAYLMSQPMLLGFVPAAALLISASQLPKVLGVTNTPGYDNALREAGWALTHTGGWGPVAIVIALVAVAVITGARRVHPLLPGVLLVAVAATAISAAGGVAVPTLGEVPGGFPPLTIDDLPWAELPRLVVSGAVIALVGFTEAASIARRFAAEEGASWSADREFVSQGVANVAAGFSGGFPCGGSFARSSIARRAGARSRLAGGVAGVTVVAFLPFAGVAEPLPLAVLGAIVISAVFGLLRFRPLVGLWRLSVPQACIAWGTFLATLALAPRLDWAVLLGVGASVLVFLWRALQLDIDVDFADGTVTLVPRGVLWFGTAQRLSAALGDVRAAHPGACRMVIDLSRLGRIDTTGALSLRSVLEQAGEAGIEATVRDIPPQSAALTARILAADRDHLG